MHLARLVARATGESSDAAADFSALLQQHRRTAESPAGTAWRGGVLVRSSAGWLAKHPDTTDVEASSQIAFWLFVMKDAIELHTVRTLALIASAPEDVRQRLSCELDSRPLTAATIGDSCISSRRASKRRCGCGHRSRFSCGVALDERSNCQDECSHRGKIGRCSCTPGLYHETRRCLAPPPTGSFPEERVMLATSPTAARSVTNPTPPLYVFSRPSASRAPASFSSCSCSKPCWPRCWSKRSSCCWSRAIAIGSRTGRDRSFRAYASGDADTVAGAYSRGHESSMSPVRSLERRHITVLFCDVVGWSSLAQRVDPEELADVIRAYRRRCATIVATARGDGRPVRRRRRARLLRLPGRARGRRRTSDTRRARYHQEGRPKRRRSSRCASASRLGASSSATCSRMQSRAAPR